MKIFDLKILLEENYHNYDNNLFNKLKCWYDRDIRWKTDSNHELTPHHEYISKFKDINKNKSAIIFTGADSIEKIVSLKEQLFYTNSLKIGMNWMFQSKYKDDLDYYFFGSYYNNSNEYREHINTYNNKNKNLIKFASVYREGTETCTLGGAEGYQISRQEAEKIGAYHFDVCLSSFNMGSDLSKFRFLGNSIIIPSVLFMLYSGVNKIYLVGADCTSGRDNSDYSGEVVYLWNVIKKFIREEYQNVEIISINPIGLKNLFTDLYIE